MKRSCLYGKEMRIVGGNVRIFGGEILAQERSVADGVLIKCIAKVGRTINRVLLKNKQLFW